MKKVLTSEEIFELLTTREYGGAMVKVACLNEFFGTLYLDEEKEEPIDPEEYVGLSYTFEYSLHSLYGAFTNDHDESALSIGFTEKGLKGFIADSEYVKDDLFITDLGI